MSDSILSLPSSSINTFWGMKDLTRYNLRLVHLENNLLEDFEHFGTHPELIELHLENNRISSFLGMTKQRSLQQLYLKGNPVALHPYYRVMALLTIGFSIQRIDDLAVEASERELARKLGANAALAASYGWLVDLAPLTEEDFKRIISEQRKKRKAQLRNTGRRCTILTVLDNVVQQKNAPVGQTDSEKKNELEAQRKQDDVHVKALTHLTQRIQYLEQELTRCQTELRRHDAPEALLPSDQQYRGITDVELKCVENVTFAMGLSLQASITSVCQTTEQVAVTITTRDITFARLFDRSHIVEIPLDLCRAVPDSTHRALVFTTAKGAVYRLSCTSELLLCVVFKCFCMRKRIPFPRHIFTEKVQEATTMEVFPSEIPKEEVRVEPAQPEPEAEPAVKNAAIESGPPPVAPTIEPANPSSIVPPSISPSATAPVQDKVDEPPQEEKDEPKQESHDEILKTEPLPPKEAAKIPPPKVTHEVTTNPPSDSHHPSVPTKIKVPAKNHDTGHSVCKMEASKIPPPKVSGSGQSRSAASSYVQEPSPGAKLVKKKFDFEMSDSDDDSEVVIKKPSWRGKDITLKQSHSDSD